MNTKEILRVLLLLFVVTYVSFSVSPNPTLTYIFSLWYVRLFSLIVLVYVSVNDVLTAIILSVLFVILVNYSNKGYLTLQGGGGGCNDFLVQSTNRTENEAGYGYKRCLMNSDCTNGAGCDVSGFCLKGTKGEDLIPQDTRVPFRPDH